MKRYALPKHYYLSEDVLSLSRDLLGKVLITRFDKQVTAGIIVETEAYKGVEDRASHAYNYRRTQRTEVMYSAGGVAYVYQCYGIHFLFNIVTAPKDIPHAILIRAVEPIEGHSLMLERRKMTKLTYAITNGPGKLTQALGIRRETNACVLTANTVCIEDTGMTIASKNIISSPRIGIDYAGGDRLNPWRFYIKNNPWISYPCKG